MKIGFAGRPEARTSARARGALRPHLGMALAGREVFTELASMSKMQLDIAYGGSQRLRRRQHHGLL